MKDILKAGVLGAGTMGSRIAAHLANAGVPVALLDLPGAADQALEALAKSKPAAFFDPSIAAMIWCGDFDNDLDSLADCDWVIEAVVEKLDVKRALLAKAAPHLRPDAIFTTNTSGLGVGSLGSSLPEPVRPYWFGAHFFNPPRYMRLLEVVPTPQTDPAAVAAIVEFADRRLGKEVVVARDTPNFIANRIGIFAMLEAMRLMEELGLGVEEVDALAGTAIGWPRSGVFRLADLIGLDVFTEIASNFPDPQSVPGFIPQMIERGWLGDKTRQGFYRKENNDRFVLDWRTLEYRPTGQVNPPAPTIESLPERIRALPGSGVPFYSRFLPALWNYAAERLPEIADSAESVDRAMRAGFNWELGPFELADAAGAGSWYVERPAPPRVIREHSGVSLVDLGDGVGLLKLHLKKDVLTPEAAELIVAVLRDGAGFDAFVISGDSANFCAGAHVPPEALQQMNAAIKFCPRPVIAAPFGSCLGAGAEMVMHAARRHPHAELSIGLDQIRAGLTPAGGGLKEMALGGPKTLRRNFETIVTARITGSALQARTLGFLRSDEHATMNRARLLSDAKDLARSIVRARYKPPAPRSDIPAPGRPALADLRARARTLGLTGRDLSVADAAALVLCGGDVAAGTPVSEQYLLDLEREAFRSLGGDQRS
jgi:3-hydroxyacyl-CoA dehydrogenase